MDWQRIQDVLDLILHGYSRHVLQRKSLSPESHQGNKGSLEKGQPNAHHSEVHTLWLHESLGKLTPFAFYSGTGINVDVYQVSTGVTVAYFSSVILLVLSAMQPPSPMKMGDTTTYFDSVVFLTMFLLAGEIYSLSLYGCSCNY